MVVEEIICVSHMVVVVVASTKVAIVVVCQVVFASPMVVVSDVKCRGVTRLPRVVVFAANMVVANFAPNVDVRKELNVEVTVQSTEVISFVA